MAGTERWVRPFADGRKNDQGHDTLRPHGCRHAVMPARGGAPPGVPGAPDIEAGPGGGRDLEFGS